MRTLPVKRNRETAKNKQPAGYYTKKIVRLLELKIQTQGEKVGKYIM
jgi:hypothetical protein